MTEAQKAFVLLERKKEEVKTYFKNLEAALLAVQAEIGVNGMFQDDQNTVYKVITPEGRFVAFDKIGYERTRRPGERAGSLSLKEAKERGFNVE